ncbi:MAG: hypothetical protein V3T22_10425 [Planctomycetota bacterium]
MTQPVYEVRCTLFKGKGSGDIRAPSLAQAADLVAAAERDCQFTTTHRKHQHVVHKLPTPRRDP